MKEHTWPVQTYRQILAQYQAQPLENNKEIIQFIRTNRAFFKKNSNDGSSMHFWAQRYPSYQKILNTFSADLLEKCQNIKDVEIEGSKKIKINNPENLFILGIKKQIKKKDSIFKVILEKNSEVSDFLKNNLPKLQPIINHWNKDHPQIKSDIPINRDHLKVRFKVIVTKLIIENGPLFVFNTIRHLSTTTPMLAGIFIRWLEAAFKGNEKKILNEQVLKNKPLAKFNKKFQKLIFANSDLENKDIEEGDENFAAQFITHVLTMVKTNDARNLMVFIDEEDCNDVMEFLCKRLPKLISLVKKYEEKQNQQPSENAQSVISQNNNNNNNNKTDTDVTNLARESISNFLKSTHSSDDPFNKGPDRQSAKRQKIESDDTESYVDRMETDDNTTPVPS